MLRRWFLWLRAARDTFGRKYGRLRLRFERELALERECQRFQVQIEHEREIFRRALDPGNEPTFVQLWVAENQENERLRNQVHALTGRRPDDGDVTRPPALEV